MPRASVSIEPVSIEEGSGHRAEFLAGRDRLVTAHLDLIPPIAARVKKRLPPSFELGDLIAEGTIGLMHAAARYRPQEHNKTPFSAYARPRIHGAIVDSVRRRRWTENTSLPLEAAPEPIADGAMPFVIRGWHSEDPAKRRGGRPAAFCYEALPKPLAIALRRLPARQRAILAAFYGDSATVSQVANRLKLSPVEVAEEHGAALDVLTAALVKNLSIIGAALVFSSRAREKQAA